MIEDLREHWYAILPSSSLGSRPAQVRRFAEAFVLWRRRDGTVVALPDACPHRRVSLAGGKVVDDCIECPFHGFRFDGEGRCRVIPAQGEAPVSPRYRADPAPPVTEAHGYIWMWRGEVPESLPPPPFFEALEGLAPNRGFSATWDVHYSRAIENQLDFTHLPFVHASSIGRGSPKAMEVECDADEHGIRAWQVGSQGSYLELLLPNIWMLRISDRLAMQAAFFPVDEGTSITHIRTFQGFIRAPVLRDVLGWVMNVQNRWILGQDERVVVTSEPRRFTPEARETLVPSDAPIIAYRRHVLRQRKAQRPRYDVSAEQLTPRSRAI